MILRDQCSSPLCEACDSLQWPCVWRDFRSDKPFTFGPIAHEGIHFVVVVLCIHIRTDGSTPILIYVFEFLSHSTFALRTSGILASHCYVGIRYIHLSRFYKLHTVLIKCLLLHRKGFVCLLLFYVLATSKMISGQAPTCDSVHSCRLYSATPPWPHIPLSHGTWPTLILLSAWRRQF